MREKQPKPRFWQAANITLAILLVTLAVLAYIVDIVFLSKSPTGSFWGILHSKEILPNLANSVTAALVIFVLFEFAAAVAVSRFVKNVVTDDEVFERLFNRKELKRIIKLAAKKLSGNDDFGEAASEIIQSLSKDRNSRVTVKSLRAYYELSDHIEDKEYYWIEGRIQYERNSCPYEFLVDAYVPSDKSDQNVHTEESEFSWLVVTGSSQRDIHKDDFILNSVTVEGDFWPISKISGSSKNKIKYRAMPTDKIELEPDQSVIIEIAFFAKQARKFGFVATTFKYLTRGYHIQVDYSGLSFVDEVWQVGHVVGDQNPTFDHRHHSPLQRVESQLSGWALPESGVTVTWMEKNDEAKTPETTIMIND